MYTIKALPILLRCRFLHPCFIYCTLCVKLRYTHLFLIINYFFRLSMLYFYFWAILLFTLFIISVLESATQFFVQKTKRKRKCGQYSVIVPPTLCVRVLPYTFCSFSYLSALSVLSYLLIIIRTNDIQNIHHTPARILVRTYLCIKPPRRHATYFLVLFLSMWCLVLFIFLVCISYLFYTLFTMAYDVQYIDYIFRSIYFLDIIKYIFNIFYCCFSITI